MGFATQAARTGPELHPTGGLDPPGLGHRPSQTTASQRHPTRLPAGLLRDQCFLSRIQALVRVESEAVAKRGYQYSIGARATLLAPYAMPLEFGDQAGATAHATWVANRDHRKAALDGATQAKNQRLLERVVSRGCVVAGLVRQQGLDFQSKSFIQPPTEGKLVTPLT